MNSEHSRYQTVHEVIAELKPTAHDAQHWLRSRGVFCHITEATEVLEGMLFGPGDKELPMRIIGDRLQGRASYSAKALLLFREGSRECYGGSVYNFPESMDDEDVKLLLDYRTELLGLEWVTKRTARHEYFMSETPRTYSYGGFGGNETYTSRPFSEQVHATMQWLNQTLGTKLNVCFLNKYDDHQQHLGWHADDFEGMDPAEPIIVMSFGAEREIWLKDKRGFKCPDCRDGYDEDRKGNCPFCEGHGFTKAPPRVDSQTTRRSSSKKAPSL